MVVDDEREIRELLREVLESRGYNVITCENGDTAVKMIEDNDVFAAFVDIRMPGKDGIQTLREIKELKPSTEVVMITGYTRNEAVNEALKLGCFVCMMKPFSIRDILGVLGVLEAGMEDLPMAA
jgi:DNA-binding NtrC family response regulator